MLIQQQFRIVSVFAILLCIMVAAKWNPNSDCSASMSPDPIFSEAEVMDMLFRGIDPHRIRGGGPSNGASDDEDFGDGDGDDGEDVGEDEGEGEGDDEEDAEDDGDADRNEEDDEDDDIDADEAELDDLLEGNLDAKCRKNYQNRQFELTFYIHSHYVAAKKAEEDLSEAEKNKKDRTAKADYFKSILDSEFLEIITDVLGEDTTLEEKMAEENGDGRKCRKQLMKSFVHRTRMATRTHHEEEANRFPAPLRVDAIFVRTFHKWLSSLKRSNGRWWSKAFYAGRRSAIFDLYRNSGKQISTTAQKSIGRCITAINKKIMQQKEELGESLEEGKSPMSFELYQKLCQWFVEKGSKDAIFARCFLTLTWNLMCRSNNTVSIRREHIKLKSDCFGVMFAHAKTDQEGFESSYCRHVYGNPKNWIICAHNALGMYLLINQGSSLDVGPLFPGSSQYRRFSKILKKTMEDHKEEMDAMNIDIDDIGVHSVSITFCLLLCIYWYRIRLTLFYVSSYRSARGLQPTAAMGQQMVLT